MAAACVPRASLACIPCRASKAKCEGTVPSAIASSSSQSLLSVPADWPCPRCQRLNRECIWKPANRTGRPVKKKKRVEDNSDSSTTAGNGSINLSPKSVSAFMSTSSSVSSTSPPSTSNVLDPLSDLDLYDFVATSLNEGTLNLFSLATDNVGFLETDGILDGPVSSSIMPAISSTTAPRMFKPAEQSNVSMVITSTPDQIQARSATLLSGVQRYFKSIGRVSPLVGLESDLMRRIDSCESILLEAISTLGHLFFEGNESQSYEEARHRCLALGIVEPEGQGDDIDAQKVVDLISAFILLTYIEFGANNEEQASVCLTRASGIALRYGFNLIDVEGDSATQHGQSSSLLAQIRQSDHHLIDAARRVWWELFLADVIVHIASSGNIARNLSSLTVSAVSSPHLPGTNDPEPYQMRIRSALLAAEIMEPGKVQLASMDSILATLLCSVQERWLIYSKQSSQQSSSDMTTEQKNAISAGGSSATMGQGLLFQTLLMLHAARLHLHRQAWFPSVTFGYETCSFGSEASAKSHYTNGQMQSSDSMMQSSIEQIISSSSSILSLMQVDAEQHFRLSQRTQWCDLPLISPNWPFVGCCYMAASYGCAFAITREKGSTSTKVTTTTMASQSQSHDKVDHTDIWKERESISNMGFAEATLGNVMQVWKVSRKYRQMVHQCRLALEDSIENMSTNRGTKRVVW